MGFLTSVANHNLLSATHLDSLAASVVRGDIIVGNSTPAWSRLAVGAANRVLFSDGTDPSWSTSPTLVGLTLSGLTLGSVVFAGTSGALSQDNAELFWDNTNKRFGLGTATLSAKIHIISADNAAFIIDTTDTAPTFDVRQGGATKGRFAYPGTSYAAQGLADSFVLASEGPLQLGVGGGSGTVTILNSTNVGVATATPGGSTTVGTAVLSLANGTVPVGGVANQVSLFSKDVAASAELFALDEAGNTPQLSPHPASRLNLTPVKATGPYAYPWAETSSNPYLGKRISVDMAGVVAAVEALTGKSFTVLENLPPEECANWDAGQQVQADRKSAEIALATACKADIQAKANAEVDVVKKAELQKQADAVIVPLAYTKKAPPKWMRDRGVVSLMEITGK